MTKLNLSAHPHFYLTDGGMETFLIFDEGIDLPEFASFVLLKSKAGVTALCDYYLRYMKIAAEHKTGFLFETPTWRANPDWGARLGLSPAELDEANRSAVALMIELKQEFGETTCPMLISGCVGPRGDGYQADMNMDAEEAQAYHLPQVRALRQAGADLVSGITMTNVSEAIGLVRAAQAANSPVVVSFTVETDGRLPSGQPLSEAIAEVDAATKQGPEWFMINCAHPTHFRDRLVQDAEWTQRIGGIRANSSCKSHAELDEATELDRGDATDLAQRCAELCGAFPNIRIVGGCCGTDHSHIKKIAASLSEQSALANKRAR